LKVNFVQYDAFSPKTPNGLVAYAVVDRRRIVYTVLISNELPLREPIVDTICKREEFDWQMCEFFEIVTCRTTPRLKKFETEVFLLNLKPDQLGTMTMKEWGPIGTDELPDGSLELFDSLPWYEAPPDT